MWFLYDLIDLLERSSSFGGGLIPGVRYSRTETAHVLRIRLGSAVEKGDVEVRLVEPGVLEIEWPRKVKGQPIPVR